MAARGDFLFLERRRTQVRVELSARERRDAERMLDRDHARIEGVRVAELLLRGFAQHDRLDRIGCGQADLRAPAQAFEGCARWPRASSARSSPR